MGSVISEIECPNCKQETCNEDYKYKSGEISHFCSECGYNRNRYIVRDEEGKAVLEDKSKEWSFENTVYETEENLKPYGALIVKHFNTGIISMLSLKEAVKPQDLIKEDNPSNIKSMELSRLVNGEIQKEMIYEHDS